MISLIFTVAFIVLQDTIPLKPSGEFEVRLDYQFKPRPAEDNNTVHLGNHASHGRNTGAGILPYLMLDVKVLSVPDEKSRVAITNNQNTRPLYRKVTANAVLELDLGFTDDMIDRVQPHEYTLTFLNAQKIPVNRIHILVDEDGSFLVNGEKRGKF